MKRSRRIIAVSFVLTVLLATAGLPARTGKPVRDQTPQKYNVPRDEVICFALYTVNDTILKLTAQLYPLKADEEKTVRLEIKDGGTWKKIAEAAVIERGWTAPFRVEGWDASRDVNYRVRHGKQATFAGTIKKDPVDKDEIVVAAFTGNSVRKNHGGDVSRQDIVDNVKRIAPDLLFFSGDQSYNHRNHYKAWTRFGEAFGEIVGSIPTVAIPDDHDVGQGNIWGAGGRKSNTGAGHDGGYFFPVAYVNEVQRAQTSHLPDPWDPAPIRRDITVYYTALNIGRVSFAIIEDRKWKSGPQGLVPQQGPRPDHIRNPDYDPKSVDVEGAVLLGERQLTFLDDWAADWKGADMKCVLSQTVFANAATNHGNIKNRLHADMDSNGWPQTGRNKALKAIRKGFAFMLCGDQHLTTLIHHGIDDWNDAGWSFCVPSIANLYQRWWLPEKPGGNHVEGMPPNTGEYKDGFGNRLTMWAAANPGTLKGDLLDSRSAGFGVVRFNCTTREITVECWPRKRDITRPETKQYPGWPKTVTQESNYARKAAAWLPTVTVTGMEDPVIQVIDEKNGESVYTLRINGTSWRPKVFAPGSYTLMVGDPDTGKEKVFTGVNALPEDSDKAITVAF